MYRAAVGNCGGPARRARELNRAGLLGNNGAAIVEIEQAAGSKAAEAGVFTVGDGGRLATRAGQNNPRVTFALNHRHGMVGQALDKPHPDAIRAALDNPRDCPSGIHRAGQRCDGRGRLTADAPTPRRCDVIRVRNRAVAGAVLLQTELDFSSI